MDDSLSPLENLSPVGETGKGVKRKQKRDRIILNFPLYQEELI
jgi:hypothetical protein